MKIASKTTMAMLLVITAYARQGTNSSEERKVTICMEGAVTPDVGVRARWLASHMFSAIGVTLVWIRGFSQCPSRAIKVSLTDKTPTDLQPGALAYALPYEGAHIRVFYDRIAETRDKALIPILLGHVLAHEITHILEGLMRHAAYGVMKAHWDLQEYIEMRSKPLEFTEEDIDLIYRGLESRAMLAPRRSRLQGGKCRE